MRKILLALLALTALPVSASAQNLLVNGGFEDSTSNFTTPPGWTNIGHTDGVLQYAAIPSQPVYEGANFYSIGGAGNFGNAAPGEGIGQSVATTAGDIYRLTFGYSDENCLGCSTVFTVNIGGFSQDFTVVASDAGMGAGPNFFTRPWDVGEIGSFTATGSSTFVSFVLKSTTNSGNNRPAARRHRVREDRHDQHAGRARAGHLGDDAYGLRPAGRRAAAAPVERRSRARLTRLSRPAAVRVRHPDGAATTGPARVGR